MGREEEGGRRSEVGRVGKEGVRWSKKQEEVIRLVEFASKINFLLR